jgi:hypothetical protein
MDDAETSEKEDRAKVRRAAARLGEFLNGYDQAVSMATTPSRDEIVAVLDEFDRERFLSIEAVATLRPGPEVRLEYVADDSEPTKPEPFLEYDDEGNIVKVGKAGDRKDSHRYPPDRPSSLN